MNQKYNGSHKQGQEEKPNTNPLKSVKTAIPETRERYDALTIKITGKHKQK